MDIHLSLNSDLEKRQPAPLVAAPIHESMPFNQAVREILVFDLNRIQSAKDKLQGEADWSSLIEFRHSVRAARRILRAMGGQFDITDLAPIPTDLRWLTKSSRSLARWCSMIDLVESYLESASSETVGVERMLHKWSAERVKSYEELLQLFASRRYQALRQAIVRISQTDRAGMFAKTIADTKVRYVLPGMIWEQYQQVRSLEEELNFSKRKFLRQIRRQVRNLYHLLAHFQAILGPAGERCRDRALRFETACERREAIQTTSEAAAQYLESYQGQETLGVGLSAFLAAIEIESQAMRESLPEIWSSVVSLKFRRNLGAAVAEL